MKRLGEQGHGDGLVKAGALPPIHARRYTSIKNGNIMSVTHGGNFKTFDWQLDDNIIDICNENERKHSYRLSEVYEIIKWLEVKFGEDWFPLGNNVALMGRGEEINGLGVAILNLSPNDITHAQGASYLGVVLEEIGLFEWNGAMRGIQWRLIKKIKTIAQLTGMFRKSKKTTFDLSEPIFNRVKIKSEASLIKLTNDVKSKLTETIIKVQYPTCLRCEKGIHEWESKYKEIDTLNKEMLDSVSNRAGIYAIYSLKGNNNWTIQYIGQTQSKTSKQRIRSHIIWRNKKTKSGKITGSKFDEVQENILFGQNIGFSFVEIYPEALRHYVEETLIIDLQPPWNKHCSISKMV